jgi:hypothetical protein
MMKKLLTVLFSIALVLPLYAQQDEFEDYSYYYFNNFNDDYDDEFEDAIKPGEPPKEAPHPAEEAPPKEAPHLTEEPAPKETPHPEHEEKPKEESAPKPKSEKKKADFERKYFEMGFGMGIGFDNGLVGLNDIFRKRIVIDLPKIAHNIPEDGSGLNFCLSTDYFMNVMNIHIGQGIWDFGFIIDVDGSVNMNIPKSLFTLISEGNIDQHKTSGKISASGGIFTEIGLKGSAKYTVGGRTLYIGFKPIFFTPAVYIPSSTGITYQLNTKNEEGKEGLFLGTKGEISVYTPTPFNQIELSRFFIGPNGLDLSLEGEYALFPFLDIGGSLASIPLSPATLTTEMKMTLKPFNIGLKGENIMTGNIDETPEFDFAEPDYNNNAKLQVYRPLRFDLYARYKPLNSEFLVITPNIGCSFNLNRDDEKVYFNAGLEARLNLMNLFIFYLGSGYREAIWRQRAGLALNLRAFELDLEAALRDQTFAGSFMERGVELTLGVRFGW